MSKRSTKIALTLTFVTALASTVTMPGYAQSDARKKYFLTISTTRGDIPAGFCGTGFHMASLWEIYNPAALKYDVTQGVTTQDSGDGPPSQWSQPPGYGWIRTGAQAFTASSVPGAANCNAYQVSSSNYYGSVVALDGTWNGANLNSTWPWYAAVSHCSLRRSVWCVED